MPVQCLLFIQPSALTVAAGPKGYLSHGHDDLTKGTTTRLHQDVGDAVNFATWARREAYAVWYIFDPDQRDFLMQLLLDPEHDLAKNSGWDGVGDPIHSQQIWLTPGNVDFLISRGIHVSIIHQRAGQAVFIPAGAPHQVGRGLACAVYLC